jgi:hypothetical protein
VTYELSAPVASDMPAGGPSHFFFRDNLTMKLDPADDQPGYVVAEFSVDGDGWHHYYGWPDAPPGTPFKFTPRGTNIKELIYGSLGLEGLSPQPWEPRDPGWGTHAIDYRAIDAAGNIGTSRGFRVTVMPRLPCTATITGTHVGDVRVDSGVVCLDGADISGDCIVSARASIVSTNTRVRGAVIADRASTVELVGGSVEKGVSATAIGGRLTIFGTTIVGGLRVADTPPARVSVTH